ncbi:hypothetical protein [Faecalibaculum rodentium]|uniref:hypothetical protein n=1 Tax=Faecalibaculum rodentium TaxID=1702221 RepID=UPI001C3C6860|nr:hypothetical protein [Faecalibaculum rodentium]
MDNEKFLHSKMMNAGTFLHKKISMVVMYLTLQVKDFVKNTKNAISYASWGSAGMHRINKTSDKCHEIWSNNRNLIENLPGKIREL